jgi:hypothetical protein
MKIKYLAVATASLACATAQPAQAELGGAPTWPALPQSMQQSRDLAAGSAPYSVVETTLASGTLVREYVTPAGTVFGVTWTGPRLPPLDTLLGAYFPTYMQALKAQRAAAGGGTPGPAAVRQTGLVVQSGGHMGAFSGRAYLPNAVPTGATINDIK